MSVTIDGTSGITAPTYGGTVTAEYSVPVTGFKNRIINGAMNIWQRGTSFSLTSTYAYCTDRWFNLGQTGTYSQSSDAPTGFKYSLSIACTSTYYGTIVQRIESQNSLDLAGQSVTVSFWAKATTGGASGLSIALDYANAVDNFSSTTNFASSTTTALTSTWTRYTATFNSLNSNVANGLQLYFYNAAGGAAAITYLISGVQLEKGSTATSFDYRPYGTELQLCQRYYEKSYDMASAPASVTNNGMTVVYGSSNAAGNQLVNCAFLVNKRTAPTMAFWSAGGTANVWTYEKSGATATATANAYWVGEHSASIYVNNGSSWVVSDAYGHWTASAEL